MIEFQLGHSVIERGSDRFNGSPLECQLPINPGPFPLVQLIHHLLGQGDDRSLGRQVGLLPVIQNAAASAFQPRRVKSLRHARVTLLKGA